MRLIALALLPLAACSSTDPTDTKGAEDTEAPIDSGDTGDSGDSGDTEDSVDPIDTATTDDDGDGLSEEDGDCDDTNAAINPAADEVCDGVDNNCDTVVDEDTAVDAEVFYADGDGDGFGDAATSTTACVAPGGFVADASDCDDGQALVNPDADEVCDDVDNDCDGAIDDETAVDAGTYYADGDGDGFGDASVSAVACQPPEGFGTDATDCDDGDAAVNPDAAEVCDSLDNNCDGAVDEDTAIDAQVFYADADADRFGDPAVTATACAAPAGYGALADDCDDTNAAVAPSATEVCDELDNNCDGLVDDADPAVVVGAEGSWYVDADGDGYGDPAAMTLACVQPEGTIADGTDCDDTRVGTNPGAAEMCDNVDNNCDGSADDLGLISFVDDAGVGTDVTAFFLGGTSTAAVSYTLDTAGTLSFCGDGTPIYATIVVEADATIEGLVSPSMSGAAWELNVLDGGQSGTVVDIQVSTVAIQGMTIQGGSSEAGDGTGGGVNISDGSLSMEDCLVQDNFAEGAGGGLYANGSAVTATNCSFVGNESDGDVGGLSFNGGSALVGAGLLVSGNLGDGGIEAGGSSSVTLTDSTISGHDGYGIKTTYDLALDACTISSNADFGAQSTGTSLTVSTTAFTGNGGTGTTNAGGLSIQNAVDALLSDLTFEDNNGGSGGGLYVSNSTFALDVALFARNYASGWGGGMFTDTANFSASNLTFDSNSAFRYGGAIFMEYLTATVTDATFSDNFTTYEFSNGGPGGAVYLAEAALTGTNLSFTGNRSADDKGSALYASATSGTGVLLTNCDVSGNVGSALYATDAILTLSACTISDNDSTGNGGAIYAESNADVSITDASVLELNDATGDGGAIYATGANVTLSGGTVLDLNTAGSDGGAIYMTGSSELTVTDATLNDNEATANGGGVYLSTSTSATFTSSSLTENTGFGYGGAVYANQASVEITSCTVTDNLGTTGGAVWLDPTTTRMLTVTTSDFSTNTTDTVYVKDVSTAYTYTGSSTFTCTTTGCTP